MLWFGVDLGGAGGTHFNPPYCNCNTAAVERVKKVNITRYVPILVHCGIGGVTPLFPNPRH